MLWQVCIGNKAQCCDQQNSYLQTAAQNVNSCSNLKVWRNSAEGLGGLV